MAHQDPDRSGEHSIHLGAEQIRISENLARNLVIFLRPADALQYLGDAAWTGTSYGRLGARIHSA